MNDSGHVTKVQAEHRSPVGKPGHSRPRAARPLDLVVAASARGNRNDEVAELPFEGGYALHPADEQRPSLRRRLDISQVKDRNG